MRKTLTARHAPGRSFRAEKRREAIRGGSGRDILSRTVFSPE